MRRISRYELLVFAVAILFMSGCPDSSNRIVVDTTDDAQRNESVETSPESNPADSLGAPRIPLGAEANPASGDAVEPTPLADDPEAPTSDSDSPGSYPPPTPSKTPHDHAHADDAPLKRDGRRPDVDDPTAPVIVTKVAEQPEDAPLNNGRESSAKPLPEGQRVVEPAADVSPDSLNAGRATGAKPGAESPGPTKANPTTKPAAPSQASLADLSESLQELDKDADGQLGLYEWPRAKLAEFKTLDSNQDGFLTPAELIAGAKKASEAATPKSDQAPKKDAKEEDKEAPKAAAKGAGKEGAPTTADAKTPPQDNEKAPAADAADESIPKKLDDGAAAKDDASPEDKPTEGS